MMQQRTLEVLDFPRIRELLAARARSPQGAEACSLLEPARSLSAARVALAELQALAEVVDGFGFPPVDGLDRIEADLATARKAGTCLEPEKLIRIRGVLEACRRVFEYLEDLAFEGPQFATLAQQMRPLDELLDRFERTFGPRGEILDGASAALRSVRSEIRAQRGRVLRCLETVLRDAELEPAVQEDFITLRGGRYVIPLRTDFRGYLKGIVHDTSRTGATFFVEPMEAVELNNRMSGLQDEEEAEVRRLLTELTGQVGREAAVIEGNIAVAAQLDVLGARLRFARALDAVAPELTDEPLLAIRQARHPLLALQEGTEVVPIDLSLAGQARLLLVTGANAGGKTVALKTAGLLALMARSGLFVPAAAGSRIGWFSAIYADIGDDQDIDRHLSTFSAHVENLRDILERADSGCLTLLDELGTGTDPREGVGLAMAVLERLLERGCRVLGTTHLSGLKAFAYARADAENASVAFDPVSGRPLYALEYGQAGSSNAFEVAERLGLPAEVVNRARSYAAGEGDATASLLAGIRQAQEAAARTAREVEALRGQWEARCREQQDLLREARRETGRAHAEARQVAKQMIEEARRDLRDAVRRFSSGQERQQQVETAIRSAAEDLQRRLPAAAAEPSPLPLDQVEPGSRVHLATLGQDGVVEEILPDTQRVRVRLGRVRVLVPATDLAPAASPSPAEAAPAARGGVRVQAQRGTSDVVVIGHTVEEAWREVEKALDRALLAAVDGFLVVHGRGTGALRRALRERLEDQPQVRGLRPERDDAATWVELG